MHTYIYRHRGARARELASEGREQGGREGEVEKGRIESRTYTGKSGTLERERVHTHILDCSQHPQSML